MNAKTLLMAAAVVSVASAFAAEVYIGTGAKEKIDYAVDTELADDVYIGERGVLVKGGEGKLTFGTDKLKRPGTAQIQVNEGSFVLKKTAAPNQPVLADTVIRTKASLWLDATVPASIVETGDGVTDWLDVRETGNASDGYVKTRATAVTDLGGALPRVLAESGSGRKYVDFNGYLSKTWMRLVQPNGSQASLFNRDVFLVHYTKTLWPCYLGECTATSQNTCYVPGDARGGDKPLFTAGSEAAYACHQSRFYWNGREIEPFTTTEWLRQRCETNVFSLLEVECLGLAGRFENLCNDRNYIPTSVATPPAGYTKAGNDYRQGGDGVCEVIAFDTQLTQAERLAVEAYLLNKWKGLQRPSAVEVKTATGSTFGLISEADAEDVKVTLSGYGAFDALMCGSGLLADFLDPNTFFGSIKPNTAAATLRNDVEVLVESAGTDISVSAPHDGRVVAKAANGKPGLVAKKGDGRARITALPAGTTELHVDEGELTLEIPRVKLEAAAMPGEDVYAYIPNADFEAIVTNTNDQTVKFTKNTWSEKLGWHGYSTDEAGFIDVTRGIGTGWAGMYWNLPTNNIPSGRGMLVLKYGVSVWVPVTIPQDGVYELSYWMSSRKGYYGQCQDLLIGEDAEHLVEFGQLFASQEETYNGAWVEAKKRTPYLKAGTYQLWFRQDAAWNMTDKCACLDDVSMKLVQSDFGEELNVIPNGDFEEFRGVYADTIPFANRTTFQFRAQGDGYAERVQNWAVASNSAPKASATIQANGYYMTGPMTRQVAVHFDGLTVGSFYDEKYSAEGKIQMAMTDESSITTRFLSPAGTYFVRLDAKKHNISANYFSAYATLKGTATINGVETNLGEITLADDARMIARDFPAPFTAGDMDEVTLRIEVKAVDKFAQLLVDNVRLAKPAAVARANLVQNGTLDVVEGGWPKYWARINDPEWNNSLIITTTDTSQAWGKDMVPGSYAVAIAAEGATAQDVAFPEAGWYRLTFRQRRRWGEWDSTHKEANPFTVELSRGATTNTIASIEPSTTNFVTSTYLFKVPQAGTWNLRFQGHGGLKNGFSLNDMTFLLDNIEIYREYLDADKPDLPSDLKVVVGKGAKLHLDFEGNINVDSARIGGQSMLAGTVVSAATFPGYVTGEGTLTTLKSSVSGTLLLFR